MYIALVAASVTFAPRLEFAAKLEFAARLEFAPVVKFPAPRHAVVAHCLAPVEIEDDFEVGEARVAFVTVEL